MVLISKHTQSWKEAKEYLNTVESGSAQTTRHFWSGRSVTLKACALGSCLRVKLLPFHTPEVRFWNHLNDYRPNWTTRITVTITQSTSSRACCCNNRRSHELFWPRAIETDAFPASFGKSKGLTSCRRQFPEGYVSSRALNRQIDST